MNLTLTDIHEVYSASLDYEDDYEDPFETLKVTITERMNRRKIIPLYDLKAYDYMTIRILKQYNGED